MTEQDTIEVESSKKDKIDEKIDKGQEKVNEAIGKGKEKLDDKIDEKQDKINDTIEGGKKFADKVANDLSKGVDDFFVNMKNVQEKVNSKVNDYKKNIIESLDIDLAEDAENYYIQVATPGINKEDVEIEAGDYEISIEATFPKFTDEIDSEDAELIISEVKEGKCIKNVSFINQIDIHNIKAVYNNGMTLITIPKIVTPKHKVTVE